MISDASLKNLRKETSSSNIAHFRDFLFQNIPIVHILSCTYFDCDISIDKLI